MSDALVLTLAREHARQRRDLAQAARMRARAAWAQVDRRAISPTWAAQVPLLLLAVSVAQQAAVVTADDYASASMRAQDQTPAPDGRVSSGSLSGIASDGRSLESLFAMPGIQALTAIKGGADIQRAMTIGGNLAELAAFNQVADAGRAADQVAVIARRRPGYVRMVVGKTCSRCIVLAGSWYRWNAGFKRHPKCDCVGIPAAEDHADALSTDPRLTFDAMDAAEQDRVFGKPSAEAIRAGADIGQVVNVRRKAAGLEVPGQVQVTHRSYAGKLLGAKRGGPRVARLMPEEIYRRAAGSQERAIALLKSNGYLI